MPNKRLQFRMCGEQGGDLFFFSFLPSSEGTYEKLRIDPNRISYTDINIMLARVVHPSRVLARNCKFNVNRSIGAINSITPAHTENGGNLQTTSLGSTLGSVRQMGNKSSRNMRRKGPKNGIRGTRGSRGTGWLTKYREGLGGRHLQGRWNVDVEEMKEWNDTVVAMCDSRTKVFFDLEYEAEEGSEDYGDGTGEGGDDTRKVGRVTVELLDNLLPLSTGNFIARAVEAAGAGGCVERVEKNVGVLFNTRATAPDSRARLTVGKSSDEEDEKEEEALSKELDYMSDILAVKNKGESGLLHIFDRCIRPRTHFLTFLRFFAPLPSLSPLKTVPS